MKIYLNSVQRHEITGLKFQRKWERRLKRIEKIDWVDLAVTTKLRMKFADEIWEEDEVLEKENTEESFKFSKIFIKILSNFIIHLNLNGFSFPKKNLLSTCPKIMRAEMKIVFFFLNKFKAIVFVQCLS